MLTMLLMMLYFSIIFIFMNHPLSMGSMLLIQTILMALITGNFYYNYWFSYILFLIMVGGMLIMFLYMTSVASNEKFSLPKLKMILFTLLFFSLIIIINYLIDPWYMNPINNSFSSINQSFMNFNNFTLNKFYNWPNMKTMIMLMIYLLLTLIATVKIVDKFSGPFRQK